MQRRTQGPSLFNSPLLRKPFAPKSSSRAPVVSQFGSLSARRTPAGAAIQLREDLELQKLDVHEISLTLYYIYYMPCISTVYSSVLSYFLGMDR